jgi:hypothetical protein
MTRASATSGAGYVRRLVAEEPPELNQRVQEVHMAAVRVRSLGERSTVCSAVSPPLVAHPDAAIRFLSEYLEEPMDIMTWATAIQAGATIIGFVFVGWQALELKQTIRGDAHDSLYTHYAGLLTMLVQRPYLHPYLYENKLVAEDDRQHPNLRQEMDLMSEAILGLIEHAVMLRHDLPGDAWNECWLPYGNERFRTSRELCRYFEINRHWYAKAIRDAFENSRANRSTSDQDSRSGRLDCAGLP